MNAFLTSRRLKHIAVDDGINGSFASHLSDSSLGGMTSEICGRVTSKLATKGTEWLVVDQESDESLFV